MHRGLALCSRPRPGQLDLEFGLAIIRDDPRKVEIEFTFVHENGAAVTRKGTLANSREGQTTPGARQSFYPTTAPDIGFSTGWIAKSTCWNTKSYYPVISRSSRQRG